jgi:hypothetical protein
MRSQVRTLSAYLVMVGLALGLRGYRDAKEVRDMAIKNCLEKTLRTRHGMADAIDEARAILREC